MCPSSTDAERIEKKITKITVKTPMIGDSVMITVRG